MIKTGTAVLFIFAALLTFSHAMAGDDLPPLNREIVGYVESVIGMQVDRGECWDLAFQALTRAGAEWDGEYRFGRRIDPGRDDILPGDIIQFRNVKIRYREGNAIFTETMAHHTAVVYKVLDAGIFELAHQNTGFSGRKVGLSNLDLSTVVSGRMWFYRPERK